MKANELRIGNYLKYLGTIIEINGITIDSDKKGLCYINTIKGIHTNTYFKPIELTEEILFKLNKNKVLKEFDELDINKVVFEFRNNKLYFTAGGGATLSDPIEFLHELQNFVFLFSKKELEINL